MAPGGVLDFRLRAMTKREERFHDWSHLHCIAILEYHHRTRLLYTIRFFTAIASGLPRPSAGSALPPFRRTATVGCYQPQGPRVFLHFGLAFYFITISHHCILPFCKIQKALAQLSYRFDPPERCKALCPDRPSVTA
jgi:hypothetical protein